MTTALAAPAPSVRVAGLGRGLAVTAVLAGLVAAVAAIAAGAPQVRGALAGAAVVAGFFALGTVVTAVAAAYTPALSLVVALTTYVLQIMLAAVVFVALTESPEARAAVDIRWTAGMVIAGALVWMATLIVTALRSREPIYDLPTARSSAADHEEVPR